MTLSALLGRPAVIDVHVDRRPGSARCREAGPRRRERRRSGPAPAIRSSSGVGRRSARTPSSFRRRTRHRTVSGNRGCRRRPCPGRFGRTRRCRSRRTARFRPGSAASFRPRRTNRRTRRRRWGMDRRSGTSSRPTGRRTSREPNSRRDVVRLRAPAAPATSPRAPAERSGPARRPPLSPIARYMRSAFTGSMTSARSARRAVRRRTVSMSLPRRASRRAARAFPSLSGSRPAGGRRRADPGRRSGSGSPPAT